MDRLDYDKINNYIDNVLNTNTISPFFINNMEYMTYISKSYKNYITLIHNSLNKFKTKSTNLSNEKIITMSKRILSSISYNYTNSIDNLLKNNLIIFTEDDDNNSSYQYDEKTDTGKLIINKCQNYSDICILIHEFMHYLNHVKNNLSYNNLDLSEFFSIYYELYAMKYLVNRRLSPKNFDIKTRLINTYECADDVINYYPLFLAYFNSKINEDSASKLGNITKHAFDIMCIRLLHHIKLKNEKDYKKTGMYIEDTLSYILGTYLSFYSIYDLELNDIVYIRKNMNRTDIDTSYLLKEVGINLDNEFEKKSISNMNKYLKELKIL